MTLGLNGARARMRRCNRSRPGACSPRADAARDRATEMRDGAGGRASAAPPGNAWRRLGFKLVVVELAIAVVLLVGAGLLGKSLLSAARTSTSASNPNTSRRCRSALPREILHRRADRSSCRAADRRTASRRCRASKSVGLASVLPVNFNGNTDWIRFVGPAVQRRAQRGEPAGCQRRDISRRCGRR